LSLNFISGIKHNMLVIPRMRIQKIISLPVTPKDIISRSIIIPITRKPVYAVIEPVPYKVDFPLSLNFKYALIPKNVCTDTSKALKHVAPSKMPLGTFLPEMAKYNVIIAYIIVVPRTVTISDARFIG